MRRGDAYLRVSTWLVAGDGVGGGDGGQKSYTMGYIEYASSSFVP